MKNILPFALELAAKTTAIDKIKVIPINEDPGYRKILTTLRIGNWKKRLMNKSVKFLTEDINNSLLINPNSKFYPYALGILKINFIFTSVILKYKIE